MPRNATSIVFLPILIAFLMLPATGKKNESNVNGAKVFAEYCAKCHTGGGNVINDKHPVADSKQLSTLAVFKAYLSSPPGHMPYYQNLINDNKTLNSLYKYCKQLKNKPAKQA